MTAQPDPQLVREIARKFLLDDDLGADDLDYVVRSHTGYDMPEGEFEAWRDAVREAADDATKTVTVTWPDEVLPWPVVVAAGAAAGVSEEDIRRWREAWAEASGQMPGWPPAAEQPQAERDADVQAVDALMTASAKGDKAAFDKAFFELRKRFVDRIAELDKRTTDGGGAECCLGVMRGHPCGCDCTDCRCVCGCRTCNEADALRESGGTP